MSTEAVAKWMIDRSYATGHGDTVEDLLKELEWQIRESERKEFAKHAVEIARKAVNQEREACAKVCETLGAEDESFYAEFSRSEDCAAAIRARGNT